MIVEFDGENEFLSNFYYSSIFYEGIVYPTNEHFFQAMKTLDPKERKEIAAADTPGKAKRMGRSVTLRPDWERIKVDVMRTGLMLKFTDAALAEKLLATGDEELVEGNWWHDQTWGSCFCPDHCRTPGRNLLGMLLMEVRKELQYGNTDNKVAHF
jgi:ribA/ribD-fused uncharacterized protein